MTLYLYENHSYYNRKIVRYNDIWQYDEAWGSSSAALSGVAFNPNNGITTTQIINYETDSPYAIGSASPSYCIVCDTYNNIVSRWWITGHTRIRNGQANLTLVRDVIADYYDEVMTAPSFIRKGYITTTSDPAIYNNEDMTFNQIKQSETTIRDKSRTAWYVLYIKDEIDADKRTITIPKPSFKLAGTMGTEEEYAYSRYLNPETQFIGDYESIGYNLYWYNNYLSDHGTYITSWRDDGTVYYTEYDRSQIGVAGTGTVASKLSNTGIAGTINNNPVHTLQDVAKGVRVAAEQNAANIDFRGGSYAITGAHTGDALARFLEEDGKYYQIGDKVKKVVINQTTTSKQIKIANSNVYAGNYLTIANRSGVLNTGTIIGQYAAVEFVAPSYYITFIDVPNATIPYTLPTNTAECVDCPYTVLAVPCGFIMMDDDGEVSTNPSIAGALVTQMLRKWSAYVIDAQLVPYAPVSDAYLEPISSSLGRILLNNFPIDVPHYTLVGDSEGEQTFVLYVDNVSWQKNIDDFKIAVPADTVGFKTANETDVYRLCSPNYNGQFEFSATKNGGVSGWTIAFSYKPFTPYIKVAPRFGGLYGRNFGDARGLVCGGDFSITQTSSEWNNYQLQNKNYQVMFDRQIENMEVNNAVQRKLEAWNIGIGVAQGATTGGIAGGMTGNPSVVVAGAIVGGATSLVGGLSDRNLNEKLRAEALSLAHDQYGYNLQNIKAIPQSPTKIGSQNADYKYFPFVEYYTCSTVEKQALLDKLTWNGMTVMRVGRFQDFLRTYYTEEGTFIQGKPIRLDYLGEDSQIAEIIAAELQTGVYVL